jgi:hypothetical protein
VITQNHDSLCGEAKPYYYDFLCDESSGLVPEFITKHIEQCQNCREQIKQLQFALSNKECIESKQGQNTSAVTTMLQLHLAYIGDRVTCEMVRPFLPGMLDPAIDIRIPTPITAHLDNCPQCIEDLKTIEGLNLYSAQLYRLSQLFSEGPSGNTKELSEISPAVSAMAKRENSGIITVFHIDESAKARSTDNSDGIYSGYPIHVDVLNPKEDVGQPLSNIDFVAALKRKASKINTKSFLKIGLMAAAAMILIGTALFFNTTSAEADVREKISKAIKNLTGVYISTYSGDRNELLQERWISQDLGLYITKAASGTLVISDIISKIQKTKSRSASVTETTPLPDDIIIGIKKKMSGSLGLMPFYDISELPPGSEWLPVPDHPRAAEGFEIYDLKWKVQKNQLWKWRFFIDPKTFLPRKIEIYKTSIGQDENLEMVMLAELKSDSEIRKVIEAAGF